jgi:quercetin dioxygenase-like cupin family protein/DNA-binding XRE family transcriptional regulator
MEGTNKIGERLATLRKERNLKTEELAARAGVLQSEIEAIEASRVSPTIAPLVKLSRALGVRMGTFLDDVGGASPVISRSGAAEEVMRASGQDSPQKGALSFHSLAQGKSGRSMEPFIVDVRPSQGLEAPDSSHEGEEFIYVLEGKIEVRYGSDIYELEAGDSIYYDSIVPHIVRSKASARILAVIYAPY